MSSSIRIIAPALLATVCWTGSAFASVPWVPSAGAGAIFTYADGFNFNGHFSNPTVVFNTFSFSPPAFIAQSVGTTSGNITDTLQVTITVNPGEIVTGVRIRENGTRSSTAMASLLGTLRVKDLTVGGISEINQNVAVANGAPDLQGNIPWNGEAFIGGLNFTGGTVFQVTLTNNLTAIFGNYIRKNGVTIEIVPAPGAFAIMGLAGLAFGRRRRA